MNWGVAVLEWLRAWPRSYKFSVLLIAAWAPFLFPESPLLAGVIMAITTTLFFLVTGPKPARRDPESLLPCRTHDADS
jgi:multisubunit Na+/H+ antiporter MnhB subunit